ncbi:PE family protein [Mycobacterium xenopi]|uniref:PE family protein n=2 Tax=Mycobacterium xenopi TaxID=1789 RepID=A0AAD1LZB5_MYCXE|nr:PE family protein [Mycobacterium xenopi]EUA23459.1 PE family protein [Mycobacterium xenopi 4042]EUA52059.1 PE family protein [Mycobacterium xenopi 3993]MDA3641611.1 PE family protein [Mycobacterium xenopi]MDA3659369.1 PE family protein [Mycobacterium xenopi]MDA3663879.1 PE family protein [Mycobacterium xenopi]
MSFVNVEPEELSVAAANLQSVGAAMHAQNLAMALSTTEVIPAAADEVSTLTAARFALQGQLYQLVSAQAAAIHQAFVAMLAASASSYTAAEASNSVAMS